MGAYDVAEHSWLAEEIAAIRRALSVGVAFWGVCLGAQLLAAAGGAVVTLGPHPEVGVEAIDLTDQASSDPVFAGLPTRFPVLQWHQDTFELPDGAQLLATSAAYRHQAFRYGRSYGLQFHLETPWDLAREWLEIEAYRSSLQQACGPDGARRLAERMSAEEASMTTIAETVISRWLDGLG
jgi:GMP synthase-like glutamine amidotransferase